MNPERFQIQECGLFIPSSSAKIFIYVAILETFTGVRQAVHITAAKVILTNNER
jgi:hypothetical protein